MKTQIIDIDWTLPVSNEVLRACVNAESSDFDTQLQNLTRGLLHRIERECQFCCFEQSVSIFYDTWRRVISVSNVDNLVFDIPFKSPAITVDSVFYHDYNLVQQEVEFSTLTNQVMFVRPDDMLVFKDSIQVDVSISPNPSQAFLHLLQAVLPIMFTSPNDVRADKRIDEQIGQFFRSL